MTDRPILLSQANVTDLEVAAVTRAVTSGWVAPLGPDVDGFEADVKTFTGVGHALALSSGTAALHLGLLGIGVAPDDEVIVPTLTFAATAFPVTYTGATPVFVDVEAVGWGMDAALLDEAIVARRRAGARVSAIVPVDMVGRTADHHAIGAVAESHGVPVLVDAAESLGADYRGRPAGSMGHAAIYSFNGNKIMTTSGGGMLVSDDEELVEKARFRSTQSREPFPWYQHEEIGFNYRMSNLLAALGRAQLARLPEMVDRRRAIRAMYAEGFADLAGVEVTKDPPWGRGNGWLSIVQFDPATRPQAAEHIRLHLAERAIESRPIWKPMHQQPVFAGNPAFLTGVADRLFDEALCLPSGVGLSDTDIERVITGVHTALVTPTLKRGSSLRSRLLPDR